MGTGRIRWERDEQMERVQGEATGRGHLGGDVEIECSGNFLEPVRVTLARTPNNGGYGAIHLL